MKKKMEQFTVCLFCGFLILMGLGCLILPREDFSVREKRYLAEEPVLQMQTLLSGDWGEDVEAYLADHMPGRDFFVGLNAYFEKYTGRQRAGKIWTEGDRLLEAPGKMDLPAIERNMGAINGFAEHLGRDVDLMLIPSAGWYCGLNQYGDDGIIRAAWDRAADRVHPVDLSGSLTERDFYRTDHHWTSAGAFSGYKAYVTALGLSPRQDFQKETVKNFRGSTYSRSGLWLTPGEDLELFTGSEDLQTEIEEEIHAGIFFREKLQEEDKYTVFLGGNHPLVRIRNPKQQGKLLVIRDSFSNCLGGFLAESFGEVVLVDLRYYKQPVRLLAEEENFDHILVCYSLSNFLTDPNLIFLNR